MRVGLLLLLANVGSGANDPRTKERIKGIRDFAKQGSSAIPAIEPYLADADLPVRLEATKAIAGIGTQRCLDPLVKALRDNAPEVQIAAVIGLTNFYHPGYSRTGARLSEENRDVVEAYVQARPDVVEGLGKVARGGSSFEARAHAARALGVLRAKAATEDLLEALKSKNSAVLFEVLIAFQKFGDPANASRVQYLLRDLDDRVQIAAIETAGILHNRAALPDLRDVMERARNTKIRRAALTSIAMMADASSRNLFLQYFKDKDDGLRGAAAEGLGRLKDPADRPAMEAAFESEKKMGPRLSAAFALVMMGKLELSEFSPLQYLINTLNSKLYRDSAAPLLAELSRQPAVRQQLYAALPKGTKEEKLRLIRILGSTGDRETLRALETWKTDADPEVSQESIKAIRSIQARLP
ncbi:MAG: HEAT repeat domain-containing protein [Bryobacteraceae bacterium]|nr:HEAT repeat domain-containing protein [Bryobacteraceae bacterium]MDW8378938.1 HEAT repeat domain-containing protein [Bryobacterales bacterium]